MGRPSLLRLLFATTLAVAGPAAGVMYANGYRVSAAGLVLLEFTAWLGVLFEAERGGRDA